MMKTLYTGRTPKRRRCQNPRLCSHLLASPPTLDAPPRQRSLSATPTLEGDTALPEPSDVLAGGLSTAAQADHDEAPFPKPTRKTSFRVPTEHTPATKRRRPTQRSQSAAQIDPWVLPKAICYVPYGKSHRHDRTTVDLVIVYMYRGDTHTNAHEKFFECPESGPETNAQTCESGCTSRGFGPRH